MKRERRIRLALRSTVGMAKWRNPEFKTARFHKELGKSCDEVTSCIQSGARGWWAFTAPPRHGKTEEVGRALPLRANALRPGLTTIYATSARDRAEEVSDAVRRGVERLYREHPQRFPHLRPGRKWTTLEWETVGGNRWTGLGIGSSTGGIDGQLLIGDDLTGSAERYMSASVRRRTERSIREDLLSRGVQWAVFMETRRGVHDTRAWLQENFADNLKCRDWPLVYDRQHHLTNPAHDARSVGDYLWPEKFGEEWHKANPQVRGQLYAQLYQQRPTPDEGALYRREWMANRYPGTDVENARSCHQRVLSVDGAATHGRGDHSVIHYWGFRHNKALLLGQWRGQWDYPVLKATLQDVIAKTNPDGILIENTSNSRAAAQELRNQFRGVIPINVSGQGGKRDRIRPTLTLWESGSVLLPYAQCAPWVPDFVERMLRVTGVGDEVDDEADAATIALSWWQNRQGRTIQVLR